MRIAVEHVLGMLAEGDSRAETILAGVPGTGTRGHSSVCDSRIVRWRADMCMTGFRFEMPREVRRRHDGAATRGGFGGRGDDMADWETCPAVESVPGRLSGAWVFKDTRVPVSSLFANLAAGATVEDFLDWFLGVEAWQVKAVLEHEVRHLDSRVEHANPR